MNFVKIFVSVIILFVAINLVFAVYQTINRKWREGLENAGNSVNILNPPPPSTDQKDVFDDMVSNRSGLPSDPLSDGTVVPASQEEPVGICNASWEGKPGKRCLDGKCYENGENCPGGNTVCKSGCCGRKDELSPYQCLPSPASQDDPESQDDPASQDDPGGGTSTPTSVDVCDVLTIHNQSAHNSTYGKWFPPTVNHLNLSQTNYEHAGRKFLNEESVKKGIRTPLVMDSESEVLGRLLWRVHLAAINQNCMNDAPQSVKTTMDDELALMKKVHQIQNTGTESSISQTACPVNSTTQSKITARCQPTGIMTDNRPGAYPNGSSQTNSIDSVVPSMSGNSSAYTASYKPTNPNRKPKPYNSIWDLF